MQLVRRLCILLSLVSCGKGLNTKPLPPPPLPAPIPKLTVIGGFSGSELVRTVFQTPDVATWAETSSFTGSPRGYGATLTFSDRHWWIGGLVGAHASNEVYSSVDGVSWSYVGALPAVRRDFGAAIFQNKMWIIGGDNDAAVTDTVWSSSDGVTWTVAPSFAPTCTAARGLSVLATSTKLYVFGGTNHAMTTHALEQACVFDGTTWSALGVTLPAKRKFMASTVWNDVLWLVGGMDDTDADASTVWSSADGSAWTTHTALTEARTHAVATVFQDKLHVIGGSLAAATKASVYTTVDGATWSTSSALPAAREAFGIFITSGL